MEPRSPETLIKLAELGARVRHNASVATGLRKEAFEKQALGKLLAKYFAKKPEVAKMLIAQKAALVGGVGATAGYVGYQNRDALASGMGALPDQIGGLGDKVGL